MKKIIWLIFAICAVVSPAIANASVKINEVAWMGTVTSSYGEWLELYNDGDVEVDLSGAKLYEEGGNVLIISLTKKIGAKSHYLIERVTPSTPDPIPEIADDMGSFGGSGLKNLPGGEYLVLKLADGTILDSIDATSGWPAGESDTKNGVRTMQWSGTSWITATATPKAPNITVYANPSNASDENSATSTPATGDNSSNTAPVSYSYSAHSGSSELSKQAPKTKAYLSAGRDRIVLAGTPVQFNADLTDGSDTILSGDNYNWAFGDAGSMSGRQAIHIYDVPGEYVVVLNASYAGQEYISRANIKVIRAEIDLKAILGNQNDYVIYITNNSGYEVNLKGWQIRTKRRTYSIGADTIVLPKKTIPFSSKLINIDLSAGEEIELLYPAGNVYLSSKVIKEEIPRLVQITEQTNTVSLTETVDKVVDNHVDISGIELWTKQLSELEDQLKKLQMSLIANVSRAPAPLRNDKIEQIVKEKEPVVEKIATSSENSEKIVILPQKRESAFWKFVTGIFGR